jgi:UDP-N-acetylglucosamine 2-epimerase (non-hydrolysing)
MAKKKIAMVCGTRPEIIKMAPVYAALARSQELTPVLIHTGQHTDLAQPLYDFFQMRVDHSLELVRARPTLAHLSARLLELLEGALSDVLPSAVLVHGDTSSAAMAALAAFYEQVPVGHVEAGLRTGERYSPFPEEMNRSLIGRMATWHYAPTPRARQALLQEGVPAASVLLTGNTVVDAAQMTAAQLTQGAEDAFVRRHGLSAHSPFGERLVLVTAHRRENWGEGLRQIAHAVADLLEGWPQHLFVWPLHPNAQVGQTVREVFAQRKINSGRLLLCEPLEYPTLVWLLQHAWLVLTDSGGIQEEAAALRVPVLVLRDSTERPELIEAGGGVLTGARRDAILHAALRLRECPAEHARMRAIVNPFGDGQAALRIVEHLEGALLA